MPLFLQPPFVAMLIAMAAWLVHSFFGPWPEVLCMPLLGGILVVAGFSLMMWARVLFTGRTTTLFVGRSSSQLVRDGPFRFSRNPMYVGVLVSLCGLALWIGTVPMYVAVLVTFMTFNFFHVPREERMLRDTFGEQYLAYSTAVRRWI